MEKIKELEAYPFEERGDALIYADIPNEVYHSEVGISSSTLRKFGHSQLHAVNDVQKTTDAMNFGTAAHYMLVEGEQAYNQEVAVLMGSPYTKAYKENKADMLERYDCVIKEIEDTHIKGMKANIIDEADMYLQAEGKLPEASFFWYEDKVLCKCRPDLICPPFKDLYKPGEIYVLIIKQPSLATQKSLPTQLSIGDMICRPLGIVEVWRKLDTALKSLPLLPKRKFRLMPVKSLLLQMSRWIRLGIRCKYF